MFICTESLLPTEKEQLTFLSLPQANNKAISVVEVGAGTAACPKGLQVIHATVEGEVDLEEVLKEQSLIKEERNKREKAANMGQMGSAAAISSP